MKFDKDFDKDFDNVFKTATRFQLIAVFAVIGGWIVGASVLGFIGWIVVKIMAHYGIL